MYVYTQPKYNSNVMTFLDKDLTNFSQIISKELQTKQK